MIYKRLDNYVFEPRRILPIFKYLLYSCFAKCFSTDRSILDQAATAYVWHEHFGNIIDTFQAEKIIGRRYSITVNRQNQFWACGGMASTVTGEVFFKLSTRGLKRP